ncbi:MAG: hypothetical protein ACP5EN_08235 [Rhodovulum sp.]
MKRINFTAALAAALVSMTAPVLAQSQLERSLGVEAGRYTTHELARIKGVEGQDNGERHVHFGATSGTRVSTSNAINARAAEIIDAMTAAADGTNKTRYAASSFGGITFTPGTGIVNERAARIIEEMGSRSDGSNS